MRTAKLIVASLVLSIACKKKVPEATEPAPAPVVEEAPKVVKATPAHVEEMAANFNLVFFELDGSDLNAESKAALDSNVKIMQSHPDLKVEIQGHADERGTTDYNLALGQRRANAVRTYMTSIGVAPSRLQVVSYGEEKPRVEGSNESSWSKNRRCEFRITWGGDSETKVIGTTE